MVQGDSERYFRWLIDDGHLIPVRAGLVPESGASMPNNEISKDKTLRKTKLAIPRIFS